MRVFGIFGHDVNDSVDRIRSPNGAARSADYLDPVNVLKQSVLNIPKNTGK